MELQPPLENISQIQFRLLSHEEIQKMAVVEITNPKFSVDDLSKNAGTVYDALMGPQLVSQLCPTCNLFSAKCAGHFGFIRLNTMIVHPLYYKRVLQFLQCICIQCSRVMASAENLHMWNLHGLRGETRISRIISQIQKINFCSNCKLCQPKISFSTTDNVYYMTFSSKTVCERVPLFVEEIFRLFNAMTDEDVSLLGFQPEFAHPRRLILQSIPVLPPRSRPGIWTETSFNNDDLTIQYNNILKINLSLNQSLPDIKREKYVQNLIFHIKTLFDNSQGKAKHTMHPKPLKGLKERMTGKSGQSRMYIMGKRTDHSARTVIGPDPTLGIDEVAIPYEIAHTLTYPERVNSHNREHLQFLVNSGQANYVMRGEVRFFVDYYKKINRELAIRDGDIVERRLRDGDIFMLNRQPSLHKGSILAMRAVLRPNKSIRMNVAITPSFNADFDGDEMNIFTPQSELARAELEEIAATGKNLIGAQAGCPVIKIVQDCLLGAYLMTKENEVFSRGEFFQMSMSLRGECWGDGGADGDASGADGASQASDPDADSEMNWISSKMELIAREFPEIAFTGKALFSLCLPMDLTYSNAGVTIRKGVLVSGAITKAHLGTSAKSLIRILAKEYPTPKQVLFLVNNVQYIAIAFLLQRGFSLGIADCITSQQETIQNVVAKCFLEAEEYELQTKDPALRESRVHMSLGKARDVGNKIASVEMTRGGNRFMDTITSGSKGDLFNITQIMGLLGQQHLSGSRMPNHVGHSQRPLVHYAHGQGLTKEKEYEARGFIRSSFVKGLKPQEFWVHACSGREGVLDTAMKTANSGYIQRKMIKVMEDAQVKYDQTVRNAADSIIQFSYGGDNLSGAELVLKNDAPLFCDVERIAERIHLELDLN